MTYQHSILPYDARLDVEVSCEVQNYWRCRYRVTDPRFSHASEWRDVEHLTLGELDDVVGAVLRGYLDDYEAQGLF